MMHGYRYGTAVFITIQLGLAIGAQAQVNSLRCAAKSLRCESNFYECLAKCDHQMEAQPNKAADTLGAQHDRCETACSDRHSKKMDTINTTPPCKVIEKTPNPRECEARFLSLEASYMVCESRCDGRANPVDCRSGCTTRYQTSQDELMAEPVCKNGRVTPTPASF